MQSAFASEFSSVDDRHSPHTKRPRSNLSAPPCVRHLIEASVAGVFGVSDQELRSVTRGRARVALARQVSMYIAHVTLGLSLTDVGRLFVRDRTTVAHACGVVEDRRDDHRFDRIIELLERVVASMIAPRPESWCPSEHGRQGRYVGS